MKRIIISSLFLLISTLGQAATESVGKVILSFGQNVAIDADGAERMLKRQSEIYSDDLLKTGNKGRLQIRFTDGSRLSLKPNTEFKIEQYQFDQSEPDDGKAIYKLLKGGMRTISGQIGKVNREDYQLDAVVATIGIRGTDFTVEKNGEQVSGSVTEGKINVAAKQGASKDIASGRSFLLVGRDGQVNVFKTPVTTTDTGNGQSKQATDGDEAEESSSEGNSSDSQTTDDQTSASTSTTQQQADTDSGAAVDPTVTINTNDGTGNTGGVPATDPTTEGAATPVLSSPNPTGAGVQALNGSVVAVAFVENDVAEGLRTSSGRVQAGGQSAITVDGSIGTGDLVTGLVYMDTSASSTGDNCTPCTLTGPPNVGNLLENGNDSAGGNNVTWGRWGSSDYVITENGTAVTTPNDLHFMYADGLTPASVITSKSGDFVYILSSTSGGYTAPTIEIAGDTGSLVDFSGTPGTGGHLFSGTYIRVNFDDQELLEIGIEGSVGGRTFALREDTQANLDLSNVLDGGDIKLMGVCANGGCGATTDLSGRMTIDFVGSNADGVITSYGVSGTADVMGAASQVTIGGTLFLEQMSSP